MDESPLLQRMRRTWETAENPVMAAIAQLTHALLTNSTEVTAALAADTVDTRLLAMVDARIEAALAALEKIPPETWDHWCEVSKKDVLGQFRNMLRHAEIKDRLRTRTKDVQ